MLAFCADSTRGLEYLQHKAQLSDTAFDSLFLAAEQGDEDALSMLTERAISKDQAHWLQKAYDFGSLDAGYHLSQSQSLNQQRQLLRELAQAGHASSQYELAVSFSKQNTRIEWLTKAAEQGLLEAKVALYQWFILNQLYEQALPWLDKAASEHAPSALLYAKTLWQQRQFEQATHWFEQALASGSKEAQTYLSLIQVFSPYSKTTEPKHAWSESRANCVMQLQFVANSLDSIYQATMFLRDFKHDSRLANLPICILEPDWVAANELDCAANWGSHNRISCDLNNLARRYQDSPATHLVIFSEQGKANVHNGVMYLDLADTYDVFVHELAHFVGFVDEYPLSAAFAAQICNQPQHPNLVIQAPQPELQPASELNWIDEAMEPPDLPKARTCNNHAAQAYKLSNNLTFMEFYDQTDIPEVYLRIWQELLGQPQIMTPMFVNFAQMHESQGQADLAEVWWAKYRAFIQPQDQIGLDILL